jgi:hypothetical protein
MPASEYAETRVQFPAPPLEGAAILLRPLFCNLSTQLKAVGFEPTHHSVGREWSSVATAPFDLGASGGAPIAQDFSHCQKGG